MTSTADSPSGPAPPENGSRQIGLQRDPMRRHTETAHWIVEDMAAAPPDVAVSSLHRSHSYGRTASQLMDAVAAPVIAINTDYLGADIDSLERYGVEVRFVNGSGHSAMLIAPERLHCLMAELCQPWS